MGPPGKVTPALYLPGLLCDDAVASGRQSHVVHLDERLAVQTESVDQRLEVAG